MIPKFRAWDTLNKIMITNFLRSYVQTERGRFSYKLATVNDNEIKATAYVNSLESLIYKYSHDLILMQSTGLKDKNGAEIFEGDIVLENGMQRVITLGEQRYEEDYGDLVYYIGFNIFTKWGYSSITPVEHEVIGNIWENPELLED